MSIKTWVTQPENKFDSFYYYDTEKLHFARIRLELGRDDGPEYNSDPGVFCEQTRYVGFVEDADDFDTENGCLWTVNKDNVIVYKAGTPHKKELSREPAPGRSTVDFSLLPGYANPQFVHIGNPIVEKKEARLPLNHAGKRVTLEMLETIAEKLASTTNDTDLGLSTESEQQLGDRIFDLYARLTGGGVLKSTSSVAAQFTEATAFFNNNELYAGEADKEDNASYADKDGLIEFIIGTELVDDTRVMEKLTTLKKYLTALISVVTNYVNRNAADKTDVTVWAEAMSHLPLMGPSKIDTQSYSRHIKGVTIATEFVHFLLDIVAQDGSAALNRFSGFLQKQGEALKFGVESNKDFYNTITIGVCVEVMKIKNEIVFVPKIKQYKVKFDRSNTKWTGACVSVEFVDINFAYQYAVNVFDYEALEDQDTKIEFDKWIAQQRKAQIENASTFFSSSFIPQKSKLATRPIK